MDYTERLTEIKRLMQGVQTKVEHCKHYVSWDDFVKKREDLHQQTADDRLWDNPDRARAITQEFSQIDDLYKKLLSYEQTSLQAQDLCALLGEEQDHEMLQDLENTVATLEKNVHVLGYEVMLCEPEDILGCYVCVHSGAGGTDAQDWAEMLLTMYMRWGDKNHKMVVEDFSPGEEAGLKSGVLRIDGRYAFGFLKTESGVHRLVRQSPYNSSGKRHTSFASVMVMPIVDKSITIVIEDKDIRVDTYRASGAGGQHVNKTDSAVRITHLPTGLVTQCQSERSQHRNKESAMNMLQARLYALEKQKQKDQESSVEKKSISWGNQIRSYVLHPYRLVKDVRTQLEHQDPDQVLQGDIDAFLEASLIHKVPVIYSGDGA